MHSECRIRRMTMDDVERVWEIDRVSFARPWPREAYAKEIRENRCARYLVAEVDGLVIGFAGGWVVLDESQVTNIAIAPDWRGKGYGRQLTAALMQYFSNLGAAMSTLEVRESNQCARHVYESLGFFRVGRRKRYYEDNGEDALIMLLDHMPEAQEDFEEPETLHSDEENAGEEENGSQI